MGRSPCCSKEGLKRGAWTAQEDQILRDYINIYGEGKWRNLPQRAGLKRCGKSCRLRWLNYLRPDIKRGNISADEEELIIRLHNLLGNRWSLIAGRLPGRTDNEIKNYWNSHLAKKVQHSNDPSTWSVAQPIQKTKAPSTSKVTPPTLSISPNMSQQDNSHVIRTNESKYSKSLSLDPPQHSSAEFQSNWWEDGLVSFPIEEKALQTGSILDFNVENVCFDDLLNNDFHFSKMCDFSYNNNEDYLLSFSDQQFVSSVEILNDKMHR